MKEQKKHPVTNTEKRKAFEKDDESRLLDKEALDEDLIDIPEVDDQHGRIVDSEHPENEEWHAREEQNRGSEDRDQPL